MMIFRQLVLSKYYYINWLPFWTPHSRCSSGLTTWRLNIDCVSPLSEELRSDILSHKVRPERIRLIVNGVDLTEVEAEKSENLPLLFPHSEEKKSDVSDRLLTEKIFGICSIHLIFCIRN